MADRRSSLTFRDFVEGFVDEHAEADCDELLLDVSPEEVHDLGVFFVRGICGWMHGLRRVRREGNTSAGDEAPIAAEVVISGDGTRDDEFLN